MGRIERIVVDEKPWPALGGTIPVRGGMSLEISGWLVNKNGSENGRKIAFGLCERRPHAAHYALADRVSRSDVAAYFKNPKLVESGFFIRFTIPPEWRGQTLDVFTFTRGKKATLRQQFPLSLVLNGARKYAPRTGAGD